MYTGAGRVRKVDANGVMAKCPSKYQATSSPAAAGG
jgi:hypothetical protein